MPSIYFLKLLSLDLSHPMKKKKKIFTRKVKSLFFFKSEISSFLLSSATVQSGCVGPVQKPHCFFTRRLICYVVLDYLYSLLSNVLVLLGLAM